MRDFLRDFQPESDVHATPYDVQGTPHDVHATTHDVHATPHDVHATPYNDVPVSRSESEMTIAELLASSIVIEWFEAVAVSQAICETVRLTGDGSGPVRIGPEHVSIDASGAVRVRAKRTKDGRSALEEVAGLLKTMLADRDVPTPLRLALSQTATNNSIEAWANTIAYYERPNRAALIQALYERATNSPAQPKVPFVPVASAPAPVVPAPQPRKPKTQSDIAQQLKRYAPAIGVAVLLSVVTGVAVWAIQLRPSDNRTSSGVAVPAAETSAIEKAPPAVSSATSAFETLVSRLPVIGRRETAVEQAPPLLRSGRWIHLPSPRSLRVSEGTVLALTRSLPQPILSVAEADGENPSPVTRVVSVNNTIYSAADGDVVPPVAVYPQFPSIPTGTNAEDVAQFDVLVTETGEVESVRARGVPASLSDTMTMTMSLSAAKAWRFRPGLRNGEPVKYLHVISILKNR